MSRLCFRGASAFFWRARPRARGALAVGLAGALLFTGCLSNTYLIPKEELQRLAQVPASERGERVRVVQDLGDDRPVPSYRPPPAPVAVEQPVFGTEQPYASDPWANDQPHFDASLHVWSHGGGGPRRASGVSQARADYDRPVIHTSSGSGGAAPRARLAGAPSGGRPHVQATPGGKSGGGGVPLPSGGGTGDADMLIVLAIFVGVLAATAILGGAVSEGARYDGYLRLPPQQPIVLTNRYGEERVTRLADLTPDDVVLAHEAAVISDDGFEDLRIGRAPLDRKGLTFKMDVGSLTTALDDYGVTGLASHIQLGVFPHHTFGVLGSFTLGGAEDHDGQPYARHGAEMEVQWIPLSWGPLHFGTFAHGGVGLVSGAKGTADGPLFGGGALAECTLTTRLALQVRADWNATQYLGHWSHAGLMTAGLALY